MVVRPFPRLLYRYFDDERWAREFVDRGRFRFSHLEYYRQLECTARGDDTEGKGFASYRDDVRKVHFDKKTGSVKGISVEPGTMNIDAASCNDRFIMCCSRPPNHELKPLASKFGGYIVKISDPGRLAEDIAAYLTFLPSPPFLLECAEVIYEKGSLLAGMPDNETLSKLSWAYKPPAYAHEHEWRYVLTDDFKDKRNAATDEPEVVQPHIYIDLDTQLDYAEMITVQV